MLHKIFRSLLIFQLGLCLTGCAYISHYQQAGALKIYSENQEEIKKYLKSQTELFYKLREDILSRRLNKGLSRKQIIARYGDPVFCKPALDQDTHKQTCLYRHPTRYFSSDMIYLTFDAGRRLESWEFIKAQN